MRWVAALLALTGCDALLRLNAISPLPDADIDAPAAPPRAHYSFEQIAPTGPCLVDDTGNGHDGTCMNDPPTLVDGPPGHGQAFAFDGNSYITIAKTADVDSTTALSVALWIAVDGYDATRQYDCFVNRPIGDIGNDAWQGCAGPTGGAFGYGNAGDNLPVLASTWTHLAMVFDGTHLTAWVDGVNVALNLANPPVYDSNFGIWIGADAEPPPQVFLIGRIDDLYIYDRALSVGEIAELAK